MLSHVLIFLIIILNRQFSAKVALVNLFLKNDINTLLHHETNIVELPVKSLFTLDVVVRTHFKMISSHSAETPGIQLGAKMV